MTKPLARFFDTLGYIALYIQFAWLLVLALPLLLQLDEATNPKTEQPSHSQQVAIDSLQVSPTTATVLTVIVILLLVIITAYALYKTPKMTADIGESVTSRATSLLMPIATHHKKISKKNRLALSRRLQFYIKISLALFAFFLTFCTYIFASPLSPGVSVTVGFMLMPWTIIWFSIHFAMTPVKS